MRSDLTQLFDQLRREPLPVSIASPDVLRREGTRRQRVRRAVTAGLAAASAAAVAATVIAVLPSPQGLVPPPGIGSPTASVPTASGPTRSAPTPTTAEPTPTETVTTEPTPTTSLDTSLVPDAAFPAHIAIDLRNGGASEQGMRTVLPALCGLVSRDVDFLRDLVDPGGLLANRLKYEMINAPDPPEAPFPEGMMFVQIMLFDEGGAARFLDSLRAAVSACRTDPDARRGPYTFAVVTPVPTYGDETFAFTASHETQDYDMSPYTCEELYEVVRVGDAVMVAEVDGWETCYAEPGLDRELRDVAIDAFVDWATTR